MAQPLFAITDSRRLLQFTTWFWHVCSGILAHSSFEILSRSFQLVDFLVLTFTLSSLHRFSIGLSSGFQLDHSKTLTTLSSNQLLTILAVCLGSLSCWKIQCGLRPTFAADCQMFSCRISMDYSFLMMPYCLTRFPVALAEKQPHSIMLPPPCLTFGTVVFSLKASPFFRQT